MRKPLIACSGQVWGDNKGQKIAVVQDHRRLATVCRRDGPLEKLQAPHVRAKGFGSLLPDVVCSME